MLLYRCLEKKELIKLSNRQKIDNPISKGSNTFDYSDGVARVHFYLFAECAQMHKKKSKEDNDYFILQYYMPYEFIKEYGGFGYYNDIINGWYTPVPEFAITEDKYVADNVIDIKSNIPRSWKSKALRAYLQRLPRGVFQRNDWFSTDFEFDQHSILKLPFETLCGISSDKSKPKTKVKNLKRKLERL